ncbi:MAG: hypothetical protein ACK5WQ_03675 [Alphaproteobacteria bacterium]|jgi:hypothetical protein|nr:hypothetical protein [Rickettsiales bacterium]
MVADVMHHPTAVAAGNLFRAALEETIKLAQAISGAVKGLVGVVSEGLKGAAATAAPSAPSIPAVAAGPPGMGRGG